MLPGLEPVSDTSNCRVVMVWIDAFATSIINRLDDALGFIKQYSIVQTINELITDTHVLCILQEYNAMSSLISMFNEHCHLKNLDPIYNKVGIQIEKAIEARRILYNT